MEFITDAATLTKRFIYLLEKHEKFYCAVAWAGISSPVYEALCNYQHKIEEAIVGIHFYQTHPDFILQFQANKNVKYIKQPQGVYHPKLYIFYTSKDSWHIIVGSANFTKSAFSINTEITVLMDVTEEKENQWLSPALQLIVKQRQAATQFSDVELVNYRNKWKLYRSKFEAMGGHPRVVDKNATPSFLIEGFNMDWISYMRQIAEKDIHSIQDRLEMLTRAGTLFRKYVHFSDLSKIEQRFIAGLKNQLTDNENVNWGPFGRMGSGLFNQVISNNDPAISLALDEIPITGLVTRRHYGRFIEHFQSRLPGNFLSCATRLLAMKRPDTFMCITSANKTGLCASFGLTANHLNYETYWTDLINRLHEAEWYVNPLPSNARERVIAGASVALLDALYYKPR